MLRRYFPECERLHISRADPAVCCQSSEAPERAMTTLYDGFDIESFEAGKGLWHARIRPADQRPVVIDGISFSAPDVGFASNDPQQAIADAQRHIHRFVLRSQGASDVAH